MIITVDHNRYFTNLTDESQIEKCRNFYSEGCTSYAISFNNLPQWVIYRTNEKGFDSLILKNMNNEYKFVPEDVKDISDSNEIIKKGLTMIELC